MKDGHTIDGPAGGSGPGTAGERVVSVHIEPAPRGRAVLRVQFARRTPAATATVTDAATAGDAHELRWLGEEYDLRERARALAAVHDLVPVWEDRSWLAGTTRRPPATCYRRRDR